MKRAGLLLIVALMGCVLVPRPASGGRRGGVVVVAPRGSVVVVQRGPMFVRPIPRVFVQPKSVFPVVVDPWRFWGVSAFSRPFFPPFSRPFFPPVVASVPVGGVYTSTVYASSPVIYPQPAPVAVPVPAPLPVPTLIEYPTGWYQLRGDGVTTPYIWVWIPKPPSPPSEAPPTTPPVPPPAPPEHQPQRSLAPRGELYRWVDEQTVVHWTDRLDGVPERYRSRVQHVS